MARFSSLERLSKSGDQTEKKHLTSPSESEESEAAAPDGGWGWVVCVASFMVNFITDGTAFSFGVLILELLDYFQDSLAKTAWVGSTLLGMEMFMGPLVSLLLQKYTVRQVTITGGLLSTAAFVASIFSPNIDVLILTYGVIGGIGFSLLFLPAVIIVGLYFNKRRAIATGIATSGSGVGVFVYAWLCDRLLAMYTWQGAVLILAGLVLNCVVCGAVFRPMTRLQGVRTRSRLDLAEEDSLSSSDTASLARSLDVVCDEKTPRVDPQVLKCLKPSALSSPAGNAGLLVFLSPDRHRGMSRSAEHLTIVQVEEVDGGVGRLCASTCALQTSAGKPTSPKQEELLRVSRGLSHPMLRKDIYYTGSVNRLPDYQHAGSMTSFLAQMTRPSTPDSSEDVIEDKECEGRCSRRSPWFKAVRKVIALHLFKDKIFLLLLVTFTMWTVQAVPITYVPDLALSKGIPRSEAALLISIIGVTNTVGRVLAGFVLDLLHLPSITLYVVALFIASGVNLAFPWCTSFALLATCAATFGLCMAVAVSMRTIVLADHLGIEQLTDSFGIVAFFQGVAFILNPPLAGKLYDVTGDYTWPFSLAAIMYLISALASLVVAILSRAEGRRKGTDTEIVIGVEDKNDFGPDKKVPEMEP